MNLRMSKLLERLTDIPVTITMSYGLYEDVIYTKP